MKYFCTCKRCMNPWTRIDIINNNNHRYHKRLGACFKFPNGISPNCIMWCIGIVAHCSPV